MNISESSGGSGIIAKAIRYYESINLIVPARRDGNGYRNFGNEGGHALRFIARARGLDFLCRKWLTFWHFTETKTKLVFKCMNWR